MTTLTSPSPSFTRSLGRALGVSLQPGDLICLQGDLGAGKTTFTQGLAEGWGSTDSVSSPTFVMVNLYRAPNGTPLYHMDAYRIESLPEAAQLGLEDMLSEGALIVEWPERIRGILPVECLWLSLTHESENERRIEIAARGAHYENLMQQMLAQTGKE